MNVQVRFFASLRELAGRESLALELSEPAGLDELLRTLAQHLDTAAMAALRAENVRVAVNQELVAAAVPLRPGDEVAFLPPVTGG